jgi:ABC-type Fe3+/spermidine/putrescine transport system ATPase subunit
MRVELKAIQQGLGITTVFVTHDQEEALAISDRVIVMNRGRIEQAGDPESVYRRPESRFVADFLGRPNVLAAEVLHACGNSAQVRLANGALLTVPCLPSMAPGQRLEVIIRADRLVLEPAAAAPRPNAISGCITSVSFLGAAAAYIIEANGLSLKAVTPIAGGMLAQGARVQVSVYLEDCAIFDLQGARLAGG